MIDLNLDPNPGPPCPHCGGETECVRTEVLGRSAVTGVAKRYFLICQECGHDWDEEDPYVADKEFR